MHFRWAWRWLALLVVLAVILVGIGVYLSLQRTFILMGTTTSTRDTGLLPYLLPQFTADTGIDVRYTAVGTGQALDLGRRGDVDVVMVHAPTLEDQFMASHDGLCRNQLMWNRFVIVGPDDDPAQVRNATSPADAFHRIYNASSDPSISPPVKFESRADNSGTYTKELQLWSAAGLNASTFGAWYEKTNQGMGATLTIANEQSHAYTLSDDGTWYALGPQMPYLRLLYQRGDAILRNQYSVIPVNPQTHPGVRSSEAVIFANWLASPHGQDLIAAYAVNGHQLFTPDFDASSPEKC